MRIADDMRKNAVFLGIGSTSEDFIASATAFFVVMEDGTGIDGTYLITAGHVARELKDMPFDIRINKSDGTSGVEHIEDIEWRFHDQFPKVDVAVAHYVPPDWADITYASSNDFTSDRHFQKIVDPDVYAEDIFWDIGAGDAVYVIGLFNLLPGKKRNAQFVYSGQIALLPGDEPIPVTDRQTGDTIYCEGYLIEAQTLQGASGSPVLVRGTVAFNATQATTHDEFGAYAHTRAFLLGLYQGAWEGEPEALFQRARGITSRRVPMGVGIVVPAIRITEVLMYDDVVAARNQRRKTRVGTQAAVQDTARFWREPDQALIDPSNPDHREDFTRLVSAAAKKRKPADQT